MPRSRLRGAAAGCLCALLLLGGCALQAVRNADRRLGEEPAPGHAIAFGRINYFVDGEIKTPYGAFRPKWQAPVVMATQLESGKSYHTAAVDNADGSFAWELPYGSYVITRIGVGQYFDDTYIAWPQVAFRISAGSRLVYLGHLRLEGTRYVEHQTMSWGEVMEFRGIRYQFPVGDEMEAQLASLGAQGGKMHPVKSLMFHDRAMPAGDRFAEAWRQSRDELAIRIFGSTLQ
jgi:hypothetical protein